MRNIFNLNLKISFKLFIITALTFTTLLVCAMTAQSYFYRRTYSVNKNRQIARNFSNLSADLKEMDMSSASVARIFQDYKEKYGMEAFIFLNDSETEKFALSDLTGYGYSGLLREGIAHFKSNIRLDMPHQYYQGSYTARDGKQYSTICANSLDMDEILFVIGAFEDYAVPSLLDRYFLYIGIAGIAVSIALSYIFSLMVSKPLVRINLIAKEMAALDFSKKIQPLSGDELGQLGSSLNTLSEKLDTTIQDLKTANIKLTADIERERELEKIRKEFVTNISHELKTPLAIIKGYGEALNDNIRVDKRDYYISQIIRQTDDMSKLVEDMLDLSRIESGQYKPHMTSFGLISLTRSILDGMQILINEKDLNIVRELPGTEAVIYADRLKIGQTIINFVQNAVRHTPSGGSIYVAISNEAGVAGFSIENEGRNIDPQKLCRIWDRFYREEEARSKKTGGTGLGLAISARILRMHQMEYGARNTERGVMFYFRCFLAECQNA